LCNSVDFEGENKMPTYKICNEEVNELSQVAELWVLALIRNQHPEWVEEDCSCSKCIEYYESLDELVSVVKD
jgi:hypothetical protein